MPSAHEPDSAPAPSARQQAASEAAGKKLYESYIKHAAPAANAPWESLSDEDKATWGKIAEDA